MMFKKLFENGLTVSKVFVLLPVIFGTLSAMILFVAATVEIIAMLIRVLIEFSHFNYTEGLQKFIVGEIIGGVDLYLIAIVLLIFSFGVYELFIPESQIENRKLKMPAILSINSLDELKDKLAKVIVMVLVVSYFQRVLNVTYNGALEMMYFAISISALSVGVYLMHKDAKFKKMDGKSKIQIHKSSNLDTH